MLAESRYGRVCSSEEAALVLVWGASSTTTCTLVPLKP
ncbi:Uncharacterised protein [Mycobacteroides abscessus subsp. abscessus]|nr:Uncharacterised protein [Mycobacteroides abscessus subsp. abscessus]